MDLFPGIDVRQFPMYRSDHAPILLDTETRCMEDYKDRLFRFESYWLSNEKCYDVVVNSWREGISVPIHARLEACANSLKEWATREFSDVKSMIKITEKKLAKAQRQAPDANMLAACNSMANDLDGLNRVEEAYWHLRSRVNELKHRDKNTKYFHHKASSRKKRNLIRGLMDDEGTWRASKAYIERLVAAYFESIFATSSPYGLPKALEGICGQ